MSWELFFGGVLVGWLLEFAVDYLFWRPRRICTDAENELREATIILKRELSRLRREQAEEAQEEQEEQEKQEDDLQRIWGIGPKVEALLFAHRITTFAQLAAINPQQLEQYLESGGKRYRVARNNVVESWPGQAALAAAGRWRELDTLQAEAAGTRRARSRRPRR